MVPYMVPKTVNMVPLLITTKYNDYKDIVKDSFYR